MKTGYTQSSGRCLVSAAERDGLVLIAVTLACRNDWQEHTALLDAGFGSFRRVCLGDGENIFSPALTLPEIKLSGAVQSTLRTALLSPVWVTLPVGTDGIECTIESERLLFAPQASGRCVGKVRWSVGNKLIAEETLVVAHSAARRSKISFWW
jgi:D-alanyl-D-alanine carboxypeptidase/D-alanyl-D-alanine carboxypeptidase (penicillin-binding protein 5/6)